MDIYRKWFNCGRRTAKKMEFVLWCALVIFYAENGVGMFNRVENNGGGSVRVFHPFPIPTSGTPLIQNDAAINMKMSSVECKVIDASAWTPRRNPSTSATSLYLLFLLKKIWKMFIQQGFPSSRWGQVLCFSFERQPLCVGHDIDMSKLRKLREDCNQNEITDLQFLINYQITYRVVSFCSWNFVRLNWKSSF